jgi:cytochrome c biogenesis protein CcdA
MIEEFQEEQRRKVSRMRSIMDYAMGALILLIGLYFCLNKVLKINVFNRESSPLDVFIGIVFILYGIWRIYSGYKKDYYR